MNLLQLEAVHKKWDDIIVIGKNIKRDGKRYHIIGMTLDEEAKLYIIEPYEELEGSCRRKGIYNQRRILKELKQHDARYLHCSEICIGSTRLQVQGVTCSCLKYSYENYEFTQLFFDMMSAGWRIPEWLKNVEWENLQLLTINFADVEKLPIYTEAMPIKIKVNPIPVQHILEKPVTLKIGKSCSFQFIDSYGDSVACYINNVTLIDIWEETENRFNDKRYTAGFSKKQLEEAKNDYYQSLEQNCPKGMYYIGIEYECSKDISLQFYSKEFLKSKPSESNGSPSVMFVTLKPDQTIGKHNLTLKGSVIQTPVSLDLQRIHAELFMYFEKIEVWEDDI